MAWTPPRRAPARKQPKLAPRPPRAPAAPKAPNQTYSTVKPAQPGFNAVAGNIAANPIAENKPKYNYLSDPGFLLAQSEIVQRYGTENEKLSAASSQDRIAMERAFDVMGGDKSGNFKGTVYDEKGVKHDGSYYADTQQAKVAANKAGLYHSGQLGQNLGDLQTNYTGRVGDIKQSFTNAEGDRDIARRDLQANYGPGGIQERKAIQASTDAFNASASAQALIDAMSAPPGGAATPAAPTRNVYKPGSLEWMKYAKDHGESWKQVGGKWYRMTASGKWMLSGN